MDRFKELELFIHVAEAGSISRAADELGLSISTASRALIALEQRMGVRLVHRTTRSAALTDAGAEFLKRGKRILLDLREAEAAATHSVASPTGVLRVTASLSFCLLHIEPLLPEFTARHPRLAVEVISANRYYDIIENNIDLAIRTREFEADSNITIRRLATTRRVLAAAPEYLKRHGSPSRPQDLSRHKLLVYAYSHDPHGLCFTRGGEKAEIEVNPLLKATDGQVIVRAALDGMGIVVQPKYILEEHVASGRLVPVLDNWELPRLTINFAFQTRLHLPAKVRLFMEALIERFEKNEYERRWTA